MSQRFVLPLWKVLCVAATLRFPAELSFMKKHPCSFVCMTLSNTLFAASFSNFATWDWLCHVVHCIGTVAGAMGPLCHSRLTNCNLFELWHCWKRPLSSLIGMSSCIVLNCWPERLNSPGRIVRNGPLLRSPFGLARSLALWTDVMSIHGCSWKSQLQFSFLAVLENFS